jgi:hypothetical protein
MDIKTFPKLPDVQSGYPLDRNTSWFSILVPEEAQNLVTNPSFEYTLNGYTAAGSATLARVSSAQRRGTYSCAVLTTSAALDGIYFPITLVGGQIYAFSLDLFGIGGVGYKLRVTADSGGALVAEKVITAKGFWQREYLIFQPPSSGVYRLGFYQTGNVAHTVYVDGWQLEANSHVTSYFDGDSSGYLTGQAAYYWNGQPHASSSTRIAGTGSGGKEVRLKDLGFFLTGVIGLGLATLANASTPISTGGSNYQRSILQPRQFTIGGAIFGNNLAQIDRTRSSLIEYLNPGRLPLDQALSLRYHRVNDVTGEDESECLQIPCVYESGLEGSVSNESQERVGVVMRQFLPLIYRDGEEGAELNQLTPISGGAVAGAYHSPDGVWSNLGGGTDQFSGPIYAAIKAPDGRVIIGGAFTQLSGAGTTYLYGVAVQSGTTWAALGSGISGLNHTVNALAVSSTGKIYAGGNFNSPGNYIASYDWPYTWSAMGSGLNGTVYGMAMDSKDRLYVIGAFTTAGGVSVNGIAMWDGAWHAVGTGVGPDLGKVIYSIVIDANDNVYVGGSFSSMDGVAAAKVAEWNGTAWAGMGLGLGAGQVNALAITTDGTLWAGGKFYSFGDGSDLGGLNIARWNGNAWYAAGSLGAVSSDSVGKLVAGPGGLLYAVGSFSQVNGVPYGAAYAVLQANTWSPLDITVIDLVTGLQAKDGNTILATPDGGLYVTYTTDFTNHPYGGYTSGTTLTNTGTGRAYPVITVYGAGQWWNIVNYRTGESIIFDNLILSPGETITLNCDPLNFSLWSNKRGDLTNKIASFSGGLSLMPGPNQVSTVMTNTLAESGDYLNQLSGYSRITGLTGANTAHGMLTLNVQVVYGAMAVVFYADTVIVATTTGTSTPGIQPVLPYGGSGIGGTINYDAISASEVVKLYNGGITARWQPTYLSLDDATR